MSAQTDNNRKHSATITRKPDRKPDRDHKPTAFQGPQQRDGDAPPHVIQKVVSSWERRPSRWQDVSRETWSNWVWQQQNRLRHPRDLQGILPLTPDEAAAIEATRDQFRMGITPHYAALMDRDNPKCPVRRQGVPEASEQTVMHFELEDPLAEERYMPVPGITHRYPDRVLFYVTHHCPVYCRHCTRKRKVSEPSSALSRQRIEQGLRYIAETREVRDVLVSGGDPLTLSNQRLGEILGRLREIEHVDVIRLGTRNPVTLPQRIDAGLCRVLDEAGPVYVHTHFNHPAEATVEAEHALRMLRRAGCVLGNQMVLLHGVNDDAVTVERLNRWLLRHGCRPYYMFQADMAPGITHFRTPLSAGINILRTLQGRLSGPGIPRFIVDLPDGGGKISLSPDWEVDRQANRITFRNWQGKEYVFHNVDDSLGTGSSAE